MSFFSEYLRDSFTDYIRYLDSGGAREAIETAAYRNVPGYIHASNLTDCPLKAAIEQTFNEADVRYPSLHKRNNPTMLFRMQEGVRVAEIMQEALLWNSSRKDYFCAVEFEMESDSMRMLGRIDACVVTSKSFYDAGAPECIYEFKHRLKKGRSMPEPRIGDIFQLLAYKVIYEERFIGHKPDPFLVIINSPSYGEFWDENAALKIYRLVEDQFGYVLVDEAGYLWDNPQNSPEFINTATLYSEMERQHLYLEGIERDKSMAPPIALSEPDAWQCRTVIRKPGEGKSGEFKVVCSAFCHDLKHENNLSREYTINKDGTWILNW